ncbi:MAG: sporulation protein [Oscillospiraceae bacterium]|nr:sporulation protein [Oscillospiraceae bacterium]
MKNRLTAAAVCTALLALCLRGSDAAQSAREALSLCAAVIIPSLFPFFVLSNLLGKLGLAQRLGAFLSPLAARLFGVSGAGLTALPVGLLGGYPLGASFVADLLSRGEIKREEAEALLSFCNNSGPAFLVSAVGIGVFGSVRAGFFLWAIHTFAALMAGLLFRRGVIAYARPAAPVRAASLAAAFPAAVRQSVTAVLNVCGFVVCFSVLLRMLSLYMLDRFPFLMLPPVQTALYGFFEIGSAIGALRALPLSPEGLALAAGILGWGGLSVHAQTAALFAEAEISLRRHTLGRLCSALISALLAYGLAFVLF